MAILEGSVSGNKAEVDASNNLKVTLPTTDSQTGKVRMMSENDSGSVIGTPYLSSPETDGDFRLRVAHESLLDTETFNYAAQNTGKHNYLNTTMTITWGTGGLTTNGSAITTTTTGVRFRTYSYFPLHGASAVHAEFNGSLNANFTATNTTLDFGFFLDGGTTPYAPTDGVFFRVNSSGIFGVTNYNTSETTTSAFTFTPTANRKYKFLIEVTERSVRFWIDDVLYGEIDTPTGQGQPFISTSLPLAVRHANTGTASAALQFVLNDYCVTYGGPAVACTLGTVGNRALGSYQGLSGGTMGTLANYANSANPTSAAGSNTAANVTGLGGQGAINAAAAAVTDFIMCSYQNPAGTAAVQGRRLRINGVRISCANLGAAVATTATTIALSLAFGHTAVSLATGEAATTKAARRIPLGMMYWNVAAPIGATPQNGDIYMYFDNPIYVNPSEFVATTLKFITGTATASQSIWYHVTFDYGWE